MKRELTFWEKGARLMHLILPNFWLPIYTNEMSTSNLMLKILLCKKKRYFVASCNLMVIVNTMEDL